MTATTNQPAPAAFELVNLKVDGIPVSVPKGTMIIRAAEEVGVAVPRFCDHPLLDPVGACRQCLVEVAAPGRDGAMAKMPKPQPACAVAVSEGMEVSTQHTSPVAEKAQEGVMEFLLINHPLDCPVCDKGGECPLQNQAMSNGRAVSRFDDVKRTYAKPVNVSTEVLLDRERCVLCQRCTRFSDQIAGDPFISLVERGAVSQIGIYQDDEFQSYFSGNTVQICPVGALTGAAYRFRSRPFDLVSTPGACEHCASGCGLRTDHRRGVVLRRMALDTPEVNEEWTCDKGRWAFASQTLPDRVQYPLVRGEDGELHVATWPEALAAAAAGLRDAAGRTGVLVGGRVSAEDAYAYSKFARIALGTNDIDFRARPHSDEEAAFLAMHVATTAPGFGGVTYADLENAKTVVLAGFEPEDESPIVFLRLRKAARKKGLKVLAVAPFASRGTEKMFGTLVPCVPGREAMVLSELATSDAGAALREAGDQGVILVGERLATAPGAFAAAVTLARTTGARLAWVPRRAGERGALEAGALPVVLPGGRPLTDEAAAELASAWGVASVPTTPGRSTGSMLQAAASGELDALVIGGVDLLDLPEPRLAREAIGRSFVVSLETRESAVTALADVVLPVAAHAEKSGTFVDWEGRLRPFQVAIETELMSDYRTLDLLAAELDVFLGTRSAGQIEKEMVRLGPWQGAKPQLSAHVAGIENPAGRVILATWHELIDGGRLQDGEPYLAGTARDVVARMSPATAASAGLLDGDLATLTTQQGSLTHPVVITPGMVDGVVWVPSNPRTAAGSARGAASTSAVLGAQNGSSVTLTKGGAL